ncbi:tetratricopeptide repeat protein [Pseudomonadota bacterium]
MNFKHSNNEISMKQKIISLCLLSIISLSGYAADDAVRDAYVRSFQYEQSQNYDDAIRALMPIYNSVPKAYTINLRIGWLYYLSGHYSNSLMHYQKAAKAQTNAVEPQLGQLLPLLAQQRYDEVEKIANKIIRTDKYNYYANLRRIIALRYQDKLESAQKATRKMRVLYPGDITFIEQEALLYEQKKDYDNADVRYRDLLVLDPENVTAKRYFGMG